MRPTPAQLRRRKAKRDAWTAEQRKHPTVLQPPDEDEWEDIHWECVEMMEAFDALPPRFRAYIRENGT